MPRHKTTRLTAQQLATLREYALENAQHLSSAGTATFYVSSTRPTERALWGKGLLVIAAEHTDKPRLRYEISDQGRRVVVTASCASVGDYALVPWLSMPIDRLIEQPVNRSTGQGESGRFPVEVLQ